MTPEKLKELQLESQNMLKEQEKQGQINQNTEEFHPDFLLNELNSYPAEEESEDSTDAETVYGIRTNFNAVNEYLNLLMKYLIDNGKLELPSHKNQPGIILRKASILKHNLGFINSKPPTSEEIEKTRKIKCFNRPIPNGSFMSLDHFVNLENEILVNRLC